MLQLYMFRSMFRVRFWTIYTDIRFAVAPCAYCKYRYSKQFADELVTKWGAEESS